MTEDDQELRGSSRRSFMKQGAVAAGAVALGASGSASAQQDNRVLVFAYDYHPGLDFNVTASLQTSTTVDILNGPEDEGVPEISQPDQYNGYVIHYQFGDQDSGMFSFLFTRQSLDEDETQALSGEAQVFSTQLNLLETSLE